MSIHSYNTPTKYEFGMYNGGALVKVVGFSVSATRKVLLKMVWSNRAEILAMTDAEDGVFSKGEFIMGDVVIRKTGRTAFEIDNMK